MNWTLRNKLYWNLNRNSNIFIQENAFESVICETAAILSRPQCVNQVLWMSPTLQTPPILFDPFFSPPHPPQNGIVSHQSYLHQPLLILKSQGSSLVFCINIIGLTGNNQSGKSMGCVINSMQPSDTIWCLRSWQHWVNHFSEWLADGSKPLPYLNQCWLVISGVLWNKQTHLPGARDRFIALIHRS